MGAYTRERAPTTVQLESEFERQVHKVRGTLVSIATRIVGPADAEDVVQQALAKTWERAPFLSGHDCYARWAIQATKTTAIDHTRGAASRHSFAAEDDVLDHFLRDGSSSPVEDRVLANAARQDVRTTLDEMRPDAAEMLFERDGCGLSYEELRESYPMSDSQMRNALYRARGDFRRRFVRARRMATGVVAASALVIKKLPAKAMIGLSAVAVVGGGMAILIPYMHDSPNYTPVVRQSTAPAPAPSPLVPLMPAAPSPTTTPTPTPTPSASSVSPAAPAPRRSSAAPRPTPKTSSPKSRLAAPVPSPVDPPVTLAADCAGVTQGGVDGAAVGGHVSWVVFNPTREPVVVESGGRVLSVPAMGSGRLPETETLSDGRTWKAVVRDHDGSVVGSRQLTNAQLNTLPVCAGSVASVSSVMSDVDH